MLTAGDSLTVKKFLGFVAIIISSVKAWAPWPTLGYKFVTDFYQAFDYYVW